MSRDLCQSLRYCVYRVSRTAGLCPLFYTQLQEFEASRSSKSSNLEAHALNRFSSDNGQQSTIIQCANEGVEASSLSVIQPHPTKKRKHSLLCIPRHSLSRLAAQASAYRLGPTLIQCHKHYNIRKAYHISTPRPGT
jgi:hypothetical protein